MSTIKISDSPALSALVQSGYVVNDYGMEVSVDSTLTDYDHYYCYDYFNPPVYRLWLEDRSRGAVVQISEDGRGQVHYVDSYGYPV